MDGDSYFLDMPCVADDSLGEELRSKLRKLQASLVRIDEKRPSAKLVESFLGSYVQLYRELTPAGKDRYPPNMALGALFDLVVSAKYAERLVADDGWTYCVGDRMHENPSAFFCYLKTCPRCSTKLGLKPSVVSNKPGSDAIGEMCGDATCEILASILKRNSTSAKIGKSSNRKGDVDFVIYDEKLLALGETKSSPLVIYPLEVALERTLTEIREGERVSKGDHTKTTVDLSQAELSMYIPHRDLRIPLGNPSEHEWPYLMLHEHMASTERVAILIDAWTQLYEIYKENLIGSETDTRKWLTCGCGGSIDDSKNKPGMDRTDDIKKGTYQVLKFGTYYKEGDEGRSIRAILASNFFPLRTYDRYFAGLADVIWTKKKYARSLDLALPDRHMVFREKDLFYLYDAVVCFTESACMDSQLEALFSLENLTTSLRP